MTAPEPLWEPLRNGDQWDRLFGARVETPSGIRARDPVHGPVRVVTTFEERCEHCGASDGRYLSTYQGGEQIADGGLACASCLAWVGCCVATCEGCFGDVAGWDTCETCGTEVAHACEATRFRAPLLMGEGCTRPSAGEVLWIEPDGSIAWGGAHMCEAHMDALSPNVSPPPSYDPGAGYHWAGA